MARQDGPEVKSLARIVQGTAVTDGQLRVPCSSIQEVDKSRIKTKDVYEGMFKASSSTGCNRAFCQTFLPDNQTNVRASYSNITQHMLTRCC